MILGKYSKFFQSHSLPHNLKAFSHLSFDIITSFHDKSTATHEILPKHSKIRSMFMHTARNGTRRVINCVEIPFTFFFVPCQRTRANEHYLLQKSRTLVHNIDFIGKALHIHTKSDQFQGSSDLRERCKMNDENCIDMRRKSDDGASDEKRRELKFIVIFVIAFAFREFPFSSFY